MSLYVGHAFRVHGRYRSRGLIELRIFKVLSYTPAALLQSGAATASKEFRRPWSGQTVTDWWKYIYGPWWGPISKPRWAITLVIVSAESSWDSSNNLTFCLISNISLLASLSRSYKHARDDYLFCCFLCIAGSDQLKWLSLCTTHVTQWYIPGYTTPHSHISSSSLPLLTSLGSRYDNRSKQRSP